MIKCVSRWRWLGRLSGVTERLPLSARQQTLQCGEGPYVTSDPANCHGGGGAYPTAVAQLTPPPVSEHAAPRPGGESVDVSLSTRPTEN